MLSEIPPTQLAAVLDETVFGLLAAAEIDGPPVDAFHVAQELGVVVAQDNRQAGRGRYVRLSRPLPTGGDAADAPSILIRSDPRPERLQWAVAHELGEHVAHEVFDQLSVDPTDAPLAAREAVANYLAARLLLPSVWFAAAGRELDWDLPGLKERFSSASHELIARRMLDFDPWIWISIFDHGRLTFRAANRPGRPPPPDALELACQHSAHHSGRPATKKGELLRVRAWPIHEPGWKREVVRSELVFADWDGP